MSHDAPLDVAVELTHRATGVDALLAGPLWGLDVTAPQRWFAAVGPDYPEMAARLDDLEHLDWTHEDGAATLRRTTSGASWSVAGIPLHPFPGPARRSSLTRSCRATSAGRSTSS